MEPGRFEYTDHWYSDVALGERGIDLSLLLMFIGAFWLTHSPLVSGIKGSEERDLVSQRAPGSRVPDAPPSSC